MAAAAPPALAPPPGHPRFPLFDGLRAVAVLAVVLTHTGHASGANEHAAYGALTARLDVGVAVFFVISGFLLHRPFAAARLAGRPLPRVLDYARRRALRILPAYWLALTLLALWPGLDGVFGERWWVYYGLLQAYDVAWILGGIPAAWSLSVEVAFYAALPVYGLLAGRALRGRAPRTQVRLELAGLAALAVASLVARFLVHRAHVGASAFDGSTFGQTLAGSFLWFALGMALAVLSAGLEGRPGAVAPRLVRALAARPGACWALAGGALLVCALALGLPRGLTATTSAREVAAHVLYGLAAACLVVPAVFAGTGGGVPRRVLAARPLQWLGLVSYGLFLWHLPLAGELARRGAGDWVPGSPFVSLTLVTLAVSVPLAAASYYALERPLLRFKHARGGDRALRAATVAPAGQSGMSPSPVNSP